MSYDWRCFFMYDNKTILKFHFDGVSIRQIAERSKKSRNTISRIITASKSVNLTPEQLDSLSDDELTLLLFPNKELMLENHTDQPLRLSHINFYLIRNYSNSRK